MDEDIPPASVASEIEGLGMPGLIASENKNILIPVPLLRPFQGQVLKSHLAGADPTASVE